MARLFNCGIEFIIEMSTSDKDEYVDKKSLAKVGVFGLLFLVIINLIFYNKKHISTSPDAVHFTQSAWIYFNNIRSYYYLKSVDSASGFEIYKHRKFTASLGEKDLNIRLIVSLREQMAFLYPEFPQINQKLESAQILTSRDTIQLFPADAFEMKENFIRLLPAVEGGESLQLFLNGQVYTNSIYANKKARKYLAQMIYDYLKLTSGR
ncbi:hypothetical protein JCM31826_15390 [Thermaurantimonas aggregans]|uniref:Uncharacterized protein n=1 Tax=Thermaurantimonas aggregans TaxID=2173829 RepID=A0A401XM20_9FLAO|nr:hypothetical protein [Thermaurantimonas aggregans]MCX8148069.1 hypothetical protein [Thermaurantimonas aggregans]GCD78057.1 hypothetical protein JCM31826_15390 [Thermaurantimonas aggregans]